MIKTIERAHTPRNMWEKIKLSRNYKRALEQIDKNLIYWPKFLIHKNKQRITKIHQYLIRMRKLRSKIRPKLVSIKKKVDRRESKREKKAEKAARLTEAIEQELLNRLNQGIYDTTEEKQDILNYPPQVFEKSVDGIAQKQGTQQHDPDLVEEGSIEEDLEVELEEEEEGEVQTEYVADFEPDEDDLEDMVGFQEDFEEDSGNKSKKRKAPPRDRAEIEYEIENELSSLAQTV